MNDFEWYNSGRAISLMIYPSVYADITRSYRVGYWLLRLSIVPQDPREEIKVHQEYKTLGEAKRATEELIVRAKLEGKI